MTTQAKHKMPANPPQSAPSGFSLIPHQKLQDIYAAMLQSSLLEERVRSLRKRRRRQPNAGLAGNSEAAAAGLLIDLRPDDAVCAAPGDLVVPFLKGVPLKRLLAAIVAPAAGPAMPLADPKHNVVPPAEDAATQFAVAAGLAVAYKANHQKQIVVTFCGAPQVESNAWRNALQFASLHNLPVLFVCQAGAEAAIAPAESERLGLPIIPVDANDAVAVYRVAFESIARARLGRGPTLIECLVCPPLDVEAMAPPSPLETMEKYLRGKGLFADRGKAKMTAQFLRKLDAASAAAQAPR